MLPAVVQKPNRLYPIRYAEAPWEAVHGRRQDHFTLGHILASPWWPTYVDATGSSDTLSLWERVGVRVPQ